MWHPIKYTKYTGSRFPEYAKNNASLNYVKKMRFEMSSYNSSTKIDLEGKAVIKMSSWEIVSLIFWCVV